MSEHHEYRDGERRRTVARLSPAAREVWEELASGEQRSKAGIARLSSGAAVFLCSPSAFSRGAVT